MKASVTATRVVAPGAEPRRAPAGIGHQAARGSFDLSRVPTEHDAGTSRSAEALPFFDRIQAAFGRHSLAGVTAAIGGSARTAADAMDADGYAFGEHVAFAQRPDLRLAAHEAAHVVMQRAPGFRPDLSRDERDAEKVAAGVASGSSVEAALDRRTGTSPSRSHRPVLQMRPRQGRKSATVAVTWIDDREELGRRIIHRVAKYFGIDEAGFWQSFVPASDQLYLKLAHSSPHGSVKLDVEFDYYPDDANNITGISRVKLEPHVDAASAAAKPAATTTAPVTSTAVPANETSEQHFSRTARETAHGMASMVASADREGFGAIALEVASDGKEIAEAFMQKLDPGARPSGAALVSADTIAKTSIGPMLDFLAGSPGKKWRYRLMFKRDARGAMTLDSWKQLDEAKTAKPMTDKQMLAEYGIPDRQQIYADIMAKAEVEVKASAVMVGSFLIEQIVLWIAGGWLAKGLGLIGEVAFPRLAALLSRGAEAEIANALKALDSAEGKELTALMDKLAKGTELGAQETARLAELYAKVEMRLNRAAAAGRAIKFTAEMKSKSRIIAEATDIDKVAELVQKFGGKAEDWVKYATRDAATGREVHWYECEGIGKIGVKFDGELDPF